MRLIIAKIFLFINMLGFNKSRVDYKQLFCIKVLKDGVDAIRYQIDGYKLRIV